MIHPKLVVPKEAIAKLCREQHISELAIFGSATRDDFRSDSDIDVLIAFKPEAHPGWFKFSDIQQELEALFKRKIDLVSKPGLNKHIRDEVLSAREIIYAE